MITNARRYWNLLDTHLKSIYISNLDRFTDQILRSSEEDLRDQIIKQIAITDLVMILNPQRFTKSDRYLNVLKL
jgi:hypothetical protein